MENKGIFFAMDALLACLIILASLVLMLGKFSEFAFENSRLLKEPEKQSFALQLSDAIVKNRNPENPSKGAAEFDEAKQRVKPNVLDETLLEQIQAEKFGEFKLAGLYKRNSAGKQYYFLEEKENCLAIERFALFMESGVKTKNVLGIVVCEE